MIFGFVRSYGQQDDDSMAGPFFLYGRSFSGRSSSAPAEDRTHILFLKSYIEHLFCVKSKWIVNKEDIGICLNYSLLKY